MKILLTSCAFALCLSAASGLTFASVHEKEGGDISTSSSRAIRYAAKNMEELRQYLAPASENDSVGFDCDNTLLKACYPSFPGVYDYELLREFKDTLWAMAGDAAKEQGLYPIHIDSKDFSSFCWSKLCRLSELKEYSLVEGELPALINSLQQVVDTFICTGLNPEREKYNALTRFGIDFSKSFPLEHKAYSLFVDDFTGTMPGWLYAQQKAKALVNMVLASNEERALTQKGPLETLYYIDNHLGTLDEIAKGFNFEATGVNLVLIHWQAHALALHSLHERGEFIPFFMEGFRKLLEVTAQRVTPSAFPRSSLQFSYSNLKTSQGSFGSHDRRRQVLDDEDTGVVISSPSTAPTKPTPISIDLRASTSAFGMNLIGLDYSSGDEDLSGDEETFLSAPVIQHVDASSIPSVVPSGEKNRVALRCSSEALDPVSAGNQGQTFLKTSQTNLVGSGEFRS
ncbi:MAG: hypothetical protein H2057_03795 [Alphaproteobacteria bacterium]|nr:hypothetical protein [Alphaproteobacteria bacterium]